MAIIQHKDITGSDAFHPFAFIGSSDPGAIGADKGWIDTTSTPAILKYRNAANTGWITYTGQTGASGADGANGIFSAIASQAEAEAGTDNVKGMSPLRTAQAIAALGSGGGSGASYNSSVTHTTASMADSASVTEAVTIAKSCMLSRLTVDKPCRVRVYRNAAFASADLSRATTTAATGQHGLVLDIVFTTGDLDWWLVGSPLYINAESTRSNQMTVTVQNLSGSTGTVGLDFEALILEA